MTGMRGASVVVVGGGVTGLSSAWWLARAGVDVLVLEAGIVGWEASGRNGGGATHVYSPLGVEEQRLWPQMDELLGYPTEHMPHRIRIALTPDQLALYQTNARIAAERGFRTEPLDAKQIKELVPIAGDNVVGGLYLHFGGHANPQRTVQAYAWALQDLGGRIRQHSPVTGFRMAGGRVTAVETAKDCYQEILGALKKTRPDADAETTRELRAAARSILPNAVETTIAVTANARALRHFLDVRGSIIGDPEMRQVCVKLYALLVEEAPELFADYEVVRTQDDIGKIVRRESA